MTARAQSRGGEGRRGHATSLSDAVSDPLREVTRVSPLECVAISLVVLVILCVGALAVAGSEERLAFLLYDDAYYYLGVAGHLAAGEGSTFDGVNPTNGYHPLWCGLLVLVMSMTRDPGTAVRLAAALWFLLAASAPLLLWWALRRRGSAAGALPAAALFGLQPFVALSLARPNGLETPLLALLLALFLGLFERAANHRWQVHKPSERDGHGGEPSARDAAAMSDLCTPPVVKVFLLWAAVGLVLGAVILARLDAGLLAVAAAVLLAWHGVTTWGQPGDRGAAVGATLSAVAGLTLGALVVAGPVLAWNEARFGAPMPVSGRVVAMSAAAQRSELGGALSLAHLKRRVGEGLVRLPLRAARTALGETGLSRRLWKSGMAGAALLLLACAGLVVRALRVRRLHGRLSGDALMLLAAYCVLHAGIYMAWLWTGGEARYRLYYFMPEFMLLAAAASAVAGPWLMKRLASTDVRTVAMALGFFLLTFHLSRGVSDTWRLYAAPAGAVAQSHVYGWIRRTLPPDAVLGARDAGKLGFFSGRPVVNLDGLANDQRFLAALRDNAVSGYIAASPIQYLLFGRPWVGEFDPARPWATPGLPPGVRGGARGVEGDVTVTKAVLPGQEDLPVTLARLALRPEITLREIPGAPDGWVVYRILRR